jgi:CheY-like chemotaxis protein
MMKRELNTLYVEDDPFSRQVLEMLFKRKLGYPNITIFEDSTDFMRRVEALSLKPNLILLDIHLTPDNGFKLLAMLRANARYRDTKVIAVTASVMVEEIELLKKAGFDSALGKPIDPEFIEEFINQVMDGKQMWSI